MSAVTFETTGVAQHIAAWDARIQTEAPPELRTPQARFAILKFLDEVHAAYARVPGLEDTAAAVYSSGGQFDWELDEGTGEVHAYAVPADPAAERLHITTFNAAVLRGEMASE